MSSSENQIVGQGQPVNDVEALVQAAVTVLASEMPMANGSVVINQEQNQIIHQADDGTVQLLVASCAGDGVGQDRLYMCTDCNLAFYGEQGEQEFQWHLRQHKPYKCDMCTEVFEHKDALKTHVRTHSLQMPFMCEKCGSAYSLKSNLTLHMKLHDDKVYQCTECNVVFKSQAQIDKHMKFHTGDTINVYQCDLCSKTFTQQKNLVQHMKIHQSGEKPFKCPECPASYSYKCHLSRHLMIHTGDKPYKCKFCGKSFNRNAHLIRHRKIHSGAEKEWKCHQCGYAFYEKSDLLRHVKSHDGNRPLKCEFCAQTFVWKRYLLRHLRNSHRSEDHHYCRECCKCLSSMDELVNHSHTEHANKRPLTHTCEVCGEEFHFKYKLDEHMYNHTGEMAHACEKCPQKFVTRRELDRHVSDHCQEVSFRCNTCEKTFSSVTELQNHVKLHTGNARYQCSVCSITFRWKSQLNSHMIVHSNTYSFTCSQCDKAFKRNRDLTRHVKIYHETTPPYTCTECNEDFLTPANLHMHKTDTHWKRIDELYGDFPCTHCTGVFKIQSDLNRHLNKVHPPRPNVCMLCRKGFTMFKFLEKHFESKHQGVSMVEGESFEIKKEHMDVKHEEGMDKKDEEDQEYSNAAIAEGTTGEDTGGFENFYMMEVDDNHANGENEHAEPIDHMEALSQSQRLLGKESGAECGADTAENALDKNFIEDLDPMISPSMPDSASNIYHNQPISEAITLAEFSQGVTGSAFPIFLQEHEGNESLSSNSVSHHIVQDNKPIVINQNTPTLKQLPHVITVRASPAIPPSILRTAAPRVLQATVASVPQPQIIRIHQPQIQGAQVNTNSQTTAAQTIKTSAVMLPLVTILKQAQAHSGGTVVQSLPNQKMTILPIVSSLTSQPLSQASVVAPSNAIPQVMTCFTGADSVLVNGQNMPVTFTEHADNMLQTDT